MACKTANTRKIVVMAEHGQKSPHKTDTDTHHGAALLHISCTMSVTVFGASAATIYQPRKLSYAACYRTGQQKTEKWTYDVCFFLESFLIVLLSGHLPHGPAFAPRRIITNAQGRSTYLRRTEHKRKSHIFFQRSQDPIQPKTGNTPVASQSH